MKVENQVCTLEQAKKLFDLGVHLNSQFAWCWNGACMIEGDKGFFLNLEGFKHEWDEAYCAYTVAELGVMLPDYYQSWYGHNSMGEPGWLSLHINKEWDANIISHLSEAEARANTLISLLENNLITPSEINTRLSQ